MNRHVAYQLPTHRTYLDIYLSIHIDIFLRNQCVRGEATTTQCVRRCAYTTRTYSRSTLMTRDEPTIQYLRQVHGYVMLRYRFPDGL